MPCTYSHPPGLTCVDCDAVPFIPYIPPHFVFDPVLGWDAGANSILRRGGNVYVSFKATCFGAIAMGFSPLPRALVTSPINLTHAWMITRVAGTPVASVIEGGVPVGDFAEAVTSASVLRIERWQGAVRYLIDDVEIYRSTVRSEGTLLVGCALYCSGDAVSDEAFAALASGTSHDTGAGSGALGLRGWGGDWQDGGWGFVCLTGNGASGDGGYGYAGVTARGTSGDGGYGFAGIFGFGAGAPIVPDIGAGNGYTALTGYGEGFSRDYGTGGASAALRGVGADGDGGWGFTGLAAFGADNPLTGFILLQTSGIWYMTAGFQRSYLGESTALDDDPTGQPTYLLSAGFASGDASATTLEGRTTAHAGIGLLDTLGVIWRVLVQAGFALDASASGSSAILAECHESLRLAGGIGTALTARNALAAALATQDAAARLTKEQLSDQAAFDGAFGTALAARQHMVDGAAFDALPSFGVTIGAVLREELASGVTVSSLLEGLSTLTDGLGATVTIRLGDTVYFAWVCNIESRAFSSYENYPFNSFAELPDGVHYGCAADGLYELGGGDDDGDPIAARVRAGLSNLGTGKMKRMPSLYLGYRSDGSLVLKVTTTSPDGERVETWYQSGARTAVDTREGRIKIGKGLKSVYFDFEIANVDGADFELDTLELLPLICDRRLGGST